MNLVRVAVVLAALPFLVFPPLAILVVLALGYLTYGLPFVVVTRDAGVLPALERTVGYATDGGAYGYPAAFLVAGGLEVALALATLPAFLRLDAARSATFAD